MNYKVSKELLEATLNYLATRPWKEVAGLMEALQKTEVIKETASTPVQTLPTKE